MEEVWEIEGKTDESARMFAESPLRAFQPASALNRVSGRARVNMIQLKELLKVYVRGDLTLLGKIPEDPAVKQAVCTYVPAVSTRLLHLRPPRW